MKSEKLATNTVRTFIQLLMTHMSVTVPQYGAKILKFVS